MRIRKNFSGAFSLSLGMELRGAYLCFRRAVQGHMDAYGVTSDQFVLLSLLAEEDGLAQRELVLRSYSDASTIGAMLRLLERDGLLRRRRDPEDGRLWQVFLTGQGRRLQRELAASHTALLLEFEATLTEEEAPVVRAWLRRTAARMRALPAQDQKKEKETA